jgi:serine/threonine-protein kinase
MSEQPSVDRTEVHRRPDASDSSPPLSPGSTVLRALGADLPRVQLRDPAGASDSLRVEPTSSEMPDLHDPPTRYELHGEIARGGMGAVLKGRDVDLGRDIALKVLLESHAGRTELLQRFVIEAQIAGQLQHPGVVPVYELGQFSDRRPYFTMKLVTGQTLSKLLADRTDPAQERTRWLGVFLQVCQTVAYAHSRGVIHRDLKPGNIMVGEYGEVQVMDWGLAKVLASRERQRPEELARTPVANAPGSAADTQAGSVLGTPAYMAPEQARGDIDRVDERADVFGLGAILCEVLTGAPPFVGKDASEAHQLAARADLADAFGRLDRCGADAELRFVCKTCLAAAPQRRPSDAGAVAAELSAYLQAVEQRLKRAELARAEAEVQAREERKRRRVQLALAGAVALLLVLGSGGGLVLQRQHEARLRERAQRDSERQLSVQTALEKAASLRQQARWTEAKTILEQTGIQIGEEAPQELRDDLERALADLRLVGELDEARMATLTWVQDRFDTAGAARRYAEAFARRGLAREGEDAATVADRVRQSPVKEQILAALDDWAFLDVDRAKKAWVTEVARRADPHPWRDRLRDPALLGDPNKLRALVDEARGEELSPQVVVALGWSLPGEQTTTLLRAVQNKHPGDFWVNFLLGFRLIFQQEQAEAMQYLRVALALRPAAPAVMNNLASALDQQNRVDEAIEWYRKALALDPLHVFARVNLGKSLVSKGKHDEAIECFTRALALSPGLAVAHTNLGVALAHQGKIAEAVACHRKAIEVDPRCGVAYSNLGSMLGLQGKLDDSIACFRRSIDADPRHIAAYINLGAALAQKGKVDEAVAWYEKGIAVDPRNAILHVNLGDLLAHRGKVEEGIACFRKAIEVDPRYAQAHGGLGEALFSKGRYAEARQALGRALQLVAKDGPLHGRLSQLFQASEGLIKLDEVLSVYLQRQELPARAEECHLFANMCKQHRQLYAAATRFYARAFVLRPALADDRALQLRFLAACAAALAACGQGKDAAALTAMQRLALRRQALTWLRAEMAAWANSGPSRRARALGLWQKHADLAGLRDPEGLKLLSAEERQACERLWADVAARLGKLRSTN